MVDISERQQLVHSLEPPVIECFLDKPPIESFVLFSGNRISP
jgi:hypothetical protein